MTTREDIAYHVASLAQRAILYEVSATPKPGLVDRNNCGAHRDMDFFTFMASSSALYRGLFECACAGHDFEGDDLPELLDRLRTPGITCEKEMFKATKGVNTHKGIIFSMGILCAASARLFKLKDTQNLSVEDVCSEVQKITRGLVHKDFKGIEDKKELTHGERLYKEFGYTGIRGEVESGFATVRKTAVPVLREWKSGIGAALNDLFLDILLILMTENQDTNVMIRGGAQGLEFVKATARAFVEAGGMKQPKAVEELVNLDRIFTEKNTSPGGSADLLAVTIFLGMLEGII